MKILQLNDMAGVGYILTKYLRKAGHQADLISFMADPFGFDKYYSDLGKVIHDQRIMQYHIRTIAKDYDLIHVHFSYQILPWLYELGKPVVIHYHGSEVALNAVDCMQADKRCSVVLVSGEQLLQYHPRARYLPNPVDTEHFRYLENEPHEGWFTYGIGYLDSDRVNIPEEIMLEVDEDYHVIDRDKQSLPYSKMPIWLNQWWGYIDIRYHKQRGLLTDLSKTALEALACGLKVLDYRGNWITELPERHKPENVAKELIGIYEGILR